MNIFAMMKRDGRKDRVQAGGVAEVVGGQKDKMERTGPQIKDYLYTLDFLFTL